MALPPEARDQAAEASFHAAYARARILSATLDGPSLAERLAALPASEREGMISGLTMVQRRRLLLAWRFWARPKQLPPKLPHRVWLILSGRGFGKSRAGAELIRERVYAGARAIAIIGPTLRDIARYMIGGRAGKHKGSGLLDVFPEEQRPTWNKQAGEIIFHTGAVAYVVSAEDGEYRGGNIDTAWCDEICKWEPGRREALWDNMEFSLRSDCGLPVQIIVTTTPNPHSFIKKLVADPECITYLGHSDENAGNLEVTYIKRLERKFGNSRKAKQERRGEILTDAEGVLFHQTVIDATRATVTPPLRRAVVSIDPAIKRAKRNDNTAITGVGIGAGVGSYVERGNVLPTEGEGDLYPLAHREGKFRPEEWATIALDMSEALSINGRPADIVCEVNRGGDLVQSTIQLVAKARYRERCEADALAGRKSPPFRAPVVIEVNAQSSKEDRASPLQTYHDLGRLHFPREPLEALEGEITEWDPRAGGKSPNGLDALVWGCYELTDGFTAVVLTGADRVRGLAEWNARGALAAPARWTPEQGPAASALGPLAGTVRPETPPPGPANVRVRQVPRFAIRQGGATI